MKIVFMGTPDFAVPSLKMLVSEGFNVAAVVTQPDRPKGRGNKTAPPPVKEYAQTEGIPVNQPERVKTPEFAEWLGNIGPDLLITVAYGRILSKEILDIPPLGCINVHASLLPKYRGAAPIQWAVLNGDAVTGITTMYTDIGMDTGDMLLKKEILIPPDMTYGELHDVLAPIGAEVLKDTLALLKEGRLLRIPQNPDEATNAPMIDKETGRIDWHKSGMEIHNLVRGTNPWPAAYTTYKGERIRIWRTRLISSDRTGVQNSEALRPGTICRITKESLIVRTGDGFLEVTEIQFDSCRKMEVYECGHNIDEGELLG